jgi:putative transcriptional regulator
VLWQLTTAGLVATMLVAGDGASRQPGNEVIVRQLAAGTLLVAGRSLPDPNFAETVVLLIEYSGEGSAGLVLNRSSGVALSRALPGVEAFAGVTAPAFIGGPVSRSTVIALSRGACGGCPAVARDVHLVKSSEALNGLLAGGAVGQRLRVYVGYAGWGGGQLDAEVRQGAWRVLAADARIVFDPDPSSLWRRMIERSETVVASLL